MSNSHFEKLDKSVHDRTTFDCGEEELNNFLRTKAASHQAANISRTLVLPGEDAENAKRLIQAFYTVSPITISRDTLPEAMAKKLPRYPVPVFLLAQLAVDTSKHGKGLGKITLICALKYLYDASKKMPAYAFVVDCLNHEAETFYLKYDFQYLCEFNGRKRLFIPVGTVVQLLS